MELEISEKDKKFARNSYKRKLVVKYCTVCGCGSYWLIKGKCRTCYQREYMRAREAKRKAAEARLREEGGSSGDVGVPSSERE